MTAPTARSGEVDGAAGAGGSPEGVGRAPHPAPDGRLAAVGGWAVRRRWPVLALWVLVLVAATLAKAKAGGQYTSTLTIPSSPAQHGLSVLKAHEPRAGGQAGQVVYVATHGTVRSDASALQSSTSNLSRVAHVLSASNPLSGQTVAKDDSVAYSSVQFAINPQTLGHSYITTIDHATAPARRAGLQVSYGGTLGQAAVPKGADAKSEAIGIVAAIIILLAAFGSVFAAGLPLLSALIAVFTGISIIGLLASAIMFSTDAPTLGTMMGLGVGIDYGLFLTTRHRQQLIEGDDPDTAVRRTLSTSGRSVMIAATTVLVAMLALYASGISFIGKLGLSAVITVVVAALAALTLVPALLSLARSQIDRLHVRRPVAEPVDEGHATLMTRFAGAVSRAPWVFALGGLVALVVLAIPFFSMRLGHVGAGSEPTSYSERQAYDAIARGFGAGANGPLTIVVEPSSRTSNQQRAALRSGLPGALRSVRDVASVGTFKPSPDNALLVGQVIPRTGPSATATQSLVQRLQGQTLPRALNAAHAQGWVSGATATTVDFQSTVSSRLPIIVGVIVAAAFVLLLLSFRSPVLALTAAILNLFSIGAAYGILVAAFQFGWGAGLLGIPGPVPIESYVPMFVFAVVFGLSMDYEVFLVSRIHEHWSETGDNRESVVQGLGQTARVISAAALIMACVFFSFLLSTSVVVKMFALGLGFSVLIDATVIRMLIVPALMFMLGRANWWTPRWLDRALPHLEG